MFFQDGYAVRAELGRRTGRTSMPSTWLGANTLLGGCNDGGLGAADTAETNSFRLAEFTEGSEEKRRLTLENVQTR